MRTRADRDRARRRWRLALAVGLLLMTAARVSGMAAETAVAAASTEQLRARVAAFDTRLREFRAAYQSELLQISHNDSIQDADSELDRIRARYARRFSDQFEAEGITLRDELLRRLSGVPVGGTGKDAALLEGGRLSDPASLSSLAGYLSRLAAELP